MKTKVAIIGAGPAGLTAGYLLSKESVDVVVLEADPLYVGGISRTVSYNGFHFDIGGHRFFSKSKAVEDLWTEILPNDMLVRPRSSRIFYGGRFFSYPLKPFEALVKLGVLKSTLCVFSWLKARGGKFEMGCRVTRCSFDEVSGAWTVEYKNAQGDLRAIEAEHIISSAPMRELVCGLSPAVSDRTKRAAESLKYRDFLTVVLILKDRQMFDDNWIYIHDPSVKVGRVQNFRSWSPEMVPEPDKVCYGLEYFCFEHDGLWDSSDNELIELAQRELIKIGLAREGDLVDGCVVRQKKAYPVYDDDYARHVATIRQELDDRY